MNKNSRVVRSEYFIILIAPFFWAIGHPLGRIVTQSVHPFQIGTITLSTGFIGLLIFLTVTKRIKLILKILPRDLLISLGLGVFGFFFYQILTFSALARIPASMNAILVSTNVVFIALLAALTLKEHISTVRILGIALALCGAVIVTFNKGFNFGESNGIDLLGCAFSLLAALSFSLYSVIGKRVLVSNDPLIIALIALFSGAVLISILAASTVGFSEIVNADLTTLGILVFLGLTMIAISYPLWFILLKRLPASHISIYIYITPVFAVILSFLILDERFSWLFWIGSALILGGIIITNRFSAANSTQQKGK